MVWLLGLMECSYRYVIKLWVAVLLYQYGLNFGLMRAVESKTFQLSTPFIVENVENFIRDVRSG